tara:strand:+ start:1401 stop:1661 length:261 start_codon:yes stop_codon:yes gene_type:complete
MRKLSLILLGTIILTLIPNLSISAKNIIQGRALVLDGDTIRIGNKKIRFSGIDSPESFYRGKKQYCYLNKKKFLAAILQRESSKKK